MIAISNDPLETQKKFKESLKAPFPFVADEQNAIIDLYDLKGFFGTKRISYVIGKGRKVLATQDGLSAINPGETVQACSLHPPETLKHIVGPPTDAGSK